MAAIGFVTTSTDVWGAEEATFELASSLQELGHDVELVCTHAAVRDAWQDRVSRHVMVVPQHGTGIRNDLDVWRGVRSASDVEHWILVNPRLALSIGVFPHPPQSRVTFVAHDVPRTPKARAVMSVSALRIDNVVAVSEYAARQFVLGRSHVNVVYGPIAHRARPATPAPPGTFTVGIVGRIVPEKNIELVIDAVAAQPAVDQLVIRGAAPADGSAYRESLLKSAQHRLGGRLRYEGRVPTACAMDGLNTLIVANAGEPMGRTVPEAQLSGVTALTPNRGGACELVENGVTGYHYEANSASSLAEHLGRLAGLRGTPSLQSLLAEARRTAATRHDPTTYAKRFCEAAGITGLGMPR